MRTTKQVTTEETVITCDFCDRVCRYAPCYCAGCGKFACEECFLRELTTIEINGTPNWNHVRAFGMVCLGPISFCKECLGDPLLASLLKLQGLVKKHDESCAKFQKQYREIAEAANDENNRRDKKFNQ